MLQINPKLLSGNLKKAPNVLPPDHRKELENLSGGAAYLYENVVKPLLDGKTPNSSELDMDAFDLDDYELLEEYYTENLSDDRPEIKKLRLLYGGLQKTTPVNIRTIFI